MEKNFNDDELSDIMKEIEALEDDLSGGKPEETSSVMEDLSKMDEAEAVPVKTHLKEVPKPTMTKTHHHASGGHTAMSFKVQGDLNMSLNFEVDGKVICLDVSEKGLHIQMEGGMTFHVPFEKKSA